MNQNQEASAFENDSIAEQYLQNGSVASPQSGDLAPNPKEKVKRSNQKQDLNMLEAASEIEIQNVPND